jgi:DNA-binding XRE family transcriptional regulator
MKKIGNTKYTTIDDLWNDKDFISEEEKAKIEFAVALIGKLIEARESRGITQSELAKMSGVKQSAIARLESMRATPQIDTLFKVLKPLGYTIAIVSDKQSNKQSNC